MLRKIHSGIEFNVRAWIAPYVSSNAEMRARARNEQEKSLSKLMNNSVFGKTVENQKKRCDIRFISKIHANPESILRKISDILRALM